MTSTWFGPDDSVQTGPVKISYDNDGVAHSAVAHLTLFGLSTQQVAIAFGIDDGVARLKGIVEPQQPSIPHFALVPVACDQLASITDITDVEAPVETLSRYFEAGRRLQRS